MLLSSFIRFLRRPPVGVFYYSKHHRKTLQTRPKATARKAPERNTATTPGNPSAIPITPTPARAFFLQLNAIAKTQPPPRTPKSKQPEAIYINIQQC